MSDTPPYADILNLKPSILALKESLTGFDGHPEMNVTIGYSKVAAQTEIPAWEIPTPSGMLGILWGAKETKLPPESPLKVATLKYMHASLDMEVAMLILEGNPSCYAVDYSTFYKALLNGTIVVTNNVRA